MVHLLIKRLKENIKPIESALDKVMKLQGVTFDWKQKEDVILDIKEDIGFIAQDVQKVVPELIRENSNGVIIHATPRYGTNTS